MQQNKEVVQLLVKIGQTLCSSKVSLTIAGHEVLEHATNLANLQQLIDKLDKGELVVAEPVVGEKSDTTTDFGT